MVLLVVCLAVRLVDARLGYLNGQHVNGVAFVALDGSGTIDKGELRGLLKALCIPSNELEVSFACAPPRDRD